MCLVLIAWRVDPDHLCVMAANRDEFHARPTAVAQWWTDQPRILAGRDLQAGGTWLGITRSGRLAALTNYRDPTRRARKRGVVPPSRGALVTSVLDSNASVAQVLALLREVGAKYDDFNLIFSDGERLGIYESASAPLLALLRDDQPAPDAQLPRTGVSLEWERLLSSAFVRSPDYGTRCSTIIRIDVRGRAYFDEWSWNSAGADIGRASLRFELERRYVQARSALL
jgi:uncharacterized protein with NRDE domain